nr:MAG TPA: hypothetical protein [Caudoviricetes sp.]
MFDIPQLRFIQIRKVYHNNQSFLLYSGTL